MMLGPGTVKTLVGAGEFCGGLLDPDGAEVAGAPGHVAFVLGEPHLPVHRRVALTLQLQRGSGFDHNLRALHHLRVDPDDWVSPFRCQNQAQVTFSFSNARIFQIDCICMTR